MNIKINKELTAKFEPAQLGGLGVVVFVVFPVNAVVAAGVVVGAFVVVVEVDVVVVVVEPDTSLQKGVLNKKLSV